MDKISLLTALSRSMHAIGLRDDLEDVLDEILAQAQDLIGFEHCALMLYDRQRGLLTVEHVRGYETRRAEVGAIQLKMGEGISGWAAQHRLAIRIGDVTRDPRYIAGLSKARSNLAVPLIVGNQVAGVINVESERPDAFTREHEEMLTILGAQAALAIIAQRAQEGMRQRIDQLNALYRISQLASHATDLDETLEAMLEIAGEVIPEGQTAILLLDEESRTLRVKAAAGYVKGVKDLSIPLGSGVTGRCAASGEIIVVEDVTQEPDAGYIEGVPGARSEIAIPLVVDQRVIGVLNAESTRPQAYEQLHRRTLSVLARQAAIVLRSAQLQSEMRRLSITDPLTGLFNRRYFSHQLERVVGQASRYGGPFAVMSIDLDRFKLINDRFGHHIGDRALEIVADTLREALRESDLMARLGGEEFAAILVHADDNTAASVAERVRSGLEEAVIEVESGERIRLTASIGIAVYPDAGSDPETLLRNADRALYRAKRAGRNLVRTAATEEGAISDADAAGADTEGARNNGDARDETAPGDKPDG